MKNGLSISIVIPVYNEENHIKACLDAIAAQTVKPLEVIVVDNNSTDKSMEIAKSYPFVRVIHESRQGRSAARTAGFNAARGDIIGRIDADSIIMPAWVERVTADFSNASVCGVTGPGRTNTFPIFSGFYTTFWSRMYFWTTHGYFEALTMWGANMAIRRSIWREIRNDVALDDALVHEDQDLSIVMLGHGGAIIQDNHLLIETASQSYLYWPKFWEYFTRAIGTKKYHLKKRTLPRSSKLKLGFWHSLPGAITGWAFTVVFMICSFVTWPFYARQMRKGKLT